MTDSAASNDILDSPSHNTRSSTTTRRPMFIETELRTDTVTTRRMASRSIQEILESTRSPTEGRQTTTYTYAHSSSYSPVTQPTNYDIPVMARRDLHEGGSLSTSNFGSPTQIFSSIRTQLSNGYSTLRKRFLGRTGDAEQSEFDSSINGSNAPGTRFVRTSSQSSASGSRSSAYNLRSRPVHSTPRDEDGEPARKGRPRKNTNDDEINEDPNEETENNENNDDAEKQQVNLDAEENNTAFYYLRKLIHMPIDIISNALNILKCLPWWLLVPLLFLFVVYTLPLLVCKPFEYYPVGKVNAACKDVQRHVDHYTKNVYSFVRRNTYERGIQNAKRLWVTVKDVKESIGDSLSQICSSTTNLFRGISDKVKNSFSHVRQSVVNFIWRTKDNAKGYCDAGIEKVNKILDDIKLEREKYFGGKQSVPAEQEHEWEKIVRQMIEEYAADETGQADYALEANGGKIVDTRCTEYTDEPPQNVVKFFGIPIVHMSKQPNIMIKHGRMPGQCFPFKGDRGSVIIRLAVPVVPTEFVLEHLSKRISVLGHINSAPKNFTVYALKDKTDKGVVIGRYMYDAENGPALQRFKPQIQKPSVIEYIELEVTSNWGNPAYTCIYRFRVHGDMQNNASPAA